MATLNFPDAPDTGDTYFDSNAGFNYEWNGTVWISKDLARPNTIREIDDISSGFDGSDTTFTLQVDGVNIVPQDVKQLVITVGGAVQNPGDDYTVSGSTLTFTTAPSASVSFYGTCLGSAVSLNTISAASVSPSSFTTTSNYTVGSINVSGASTITNFILTGFTTITDPDVTYLNNTGVGTVSNVILTQDNSGLGATIGAAVGVVTYYGDGSNLAGAALTMMPLSYDPGISSTSQSKDTNINTTWNRPIEAGSGTITIREGSTSGTVVDQFVVGSSSSITFSGNQLTLNPAANLGFATTFYVTYPAGSIKAVGGQHENSQVITDFTTAAASVALFGWGENGQGNLGQNNIIAHSSPTQLVGTWTQSLNVYGRVAHSVLEGATGTIWTIGQGSAGRLAQNNVILYSSPVQVGTDTDWGVASTTQGGVAAVKTSGQLWVWGNNEKGKLGLNAPDSEFKSSPVQVGTDTTWGKTIGKQTSGQNSSLNIKTDGTLWCWGDNEVGELGQNSISGTGLSSPTQIGTDTTWSSFGHSANEAHCAFKTDGTLWLWGLNVQGMLGLNQGPGNNRSSPTQLPGSWASCNLTYSLGAFTRTDGTLWMCGRNNSGGGGHNDTTARSSPTQVGTDTNWDTGYESLSAMYDSPRALKTDGTLWSWGSNGNGILGLNDEVQRSSPTQIGTGTAWTGLRTADNTTWATTLQ